MTTTAQTQPTTEKYKKKDLEKVLSKEQLDMVNYELLKGTTAGKVAIIIQEEFGIFTEISHEAVRQFIIRYNNKVIKTQKDHISKAMGLDNTPAVAAAISKVVEKIDIIGEMAELVLVQKKRVGKLLKREADMPMLFNSLGGEIKTLAGLINQYAEHSFDIGTLRKIPQVTKVTKNGLETLIESSGRDHVLGNVERAKQVDEAAAKFFEALQAGESLPPTESTEESDHG
jgi:hypothetical protein